jgi:gas vesicle protein
MGFRSICLAGEDTMENKIKRPAHNMIHAKYLAIGMLVGGLAGAAAMLLLAPQSGKKTRAQIQLRSIQWLDQTTDLGKKALSQARYDSHEIATGVREKVLHFKHQGQDQLAKQLDHISAAVKAA